MLTYRGNNEHLDRVVNQHNLLRERLLHIGENLNEVENARNANKRLIIQYEQHLVFIRGDKTPQEWRLGNRETINANINLLTQRRAQYQMGPTFLIPIEEPRNVQTQNYQNIPTPDQVEWDWKTRGLVAVKGTLFAAGGVLIASGVSGATATLKTGVKVASKESVKVAAKVVGKEVAKKVVTKEGAKQVAVRSGAQIAAGVGLIGLSYKIQNK